MLWNRDTLLKESIDWKNIDMVTLHEEEPNGKDKQNEAQTRRNPKRHISLLCLLLWHKIVAVCCFVWALGL